MELVIAEKPSVAQSIAAVLGATQRKDGYLEGNEYLVSWCVGHLVELAQPESYEEAWKKWSYESLPIIPQEWQHEVKSDTKAQYQILKKLMHDDRVDAVVCATDAGREGELIFRLTYNMAGCRKPMKRLWISSMEESAIRDGFHNLRPGSDYDNLYHSALCRQEADWLVGINGTRLFTVLYGGKALKVDRVQTPTLAMLVDRESKIMNFKKEAYYMAHIMGNGLDAVSEHISYKTEAERIAGACENGQALVTSVVKEEKWVAPPKLYDLTTLQRDANRLFGFTAKQTLEYTQSLYEKKLVTYPRTDSQYLSDDMEGTAKNVIEAIFNSLLFEQNIMFNPDIKRILNSKKVTDHHAIIPTMEIIKQDLKAIPESEMKILSLCANRLLCATGEKHIYNSTKAVITCNNTVFKVSGKEVWKNGWKEFEDFFKNSYKTAEDKSDAEEEKKLPELREGMTIAVEQTRVSEHFTQPPKHYTEDSLLSAMERAGAEDMGDEVERKGLGTPATRADIIEKLVKDGFVKREKKQMIPTEDGMKLITILPDVVKSPKLTADWENELTLVSKGEVAAEQFMSGIEAMVTDLVKTYHSVSDEQKAMFGTGKGEQEVLGKALATGNPYIKEKMDLDIQVSKLKLMKANHTSQKYRLEDNITQHYPHQIAIFKERIEGFTADMNKYAKNKPEDKEQFFMQVGGKSYTDKKEAGTAIIAMCKEIKGINASADVGEYLGFKLNVTFDSFNNKFVMNVKGAMSHPMEVGSDPLGNITRINNVLEAMPSQLEEAQMKLSNVKHQLETAKAEVDKPFPQEAELAEKLERLAELNSLLNMDEKGDDAIGMDDEAAEPEKPQETVKTVDNKRDEVADMPAKQSNLGKTAVGGKLSDRPAERTSLQEKLAAMKARVSGTPVGRDAADKTKKKEEIL